MNAEPLSPALLQAVEDYLKATQDPSKQCFQNIFPTEVVRESIVSGIKESLAGGMTEQDAIAQLKKMCEP